jgi:Ion channel
MNAAVSYNNWGANFAVVATTAVAVVVCALMHYEGLAWINRSLARVGRPKRRVVLYAILALMALHIVEIWLFGLGYHVLLLWPETGRLAGAIGHSVFDHVYFSATVFTTVGFGDLSPSGPIRFLAGTEGLTGLVLVGWSASFTYLEMEEVWRPRR